ncbi:hypothetical protein AX16_006052 [Volvariella volvacea WC 439]|nr:hypothetical protein AX16_006052 [Volvariella volvacea WC 439]
MSYDGTVGALQIGVLISTFLFGVTTLQCIRYFANFPKDKPTIKFMVCVVWLLELAHTISTASGLYHITMSQYNAPQLDPQPKLDLGFRIAVLFSGCIAALVQAYYTDRLRILTENAFLASIYWVLASVRLIGWILATILLLGYDLKTPSMSPAANLRMEISDAIANSSSPVIQPRYTGQNDSSTIGITWPLLPLLAGGAAIDVSITGIICYYVRKSRETIGQVEG